MSLSAGTRIEFYQSLSPLGAGGMGEVYRALDTGLNCEVALKMLPAALAGDAERMAESGRPSPLPVEEALPIARQIADTLEYSHEKRIVHRDLKPANIKISPDGKIKRLDFGLAKATEPRAPEAPAASPWSATASLAATQAGTVLGTAAYMCPEQWIGRIGCLLSLRSSQRAPPPLVS